MDTQTELPKAIDTDKVSATQQPKSNPPSVAKRVELEIIEWDRLPPDEREAVLCQLRIKAEEARQFAVAVDASGEKDTGWKRLAMTWASLLKKVQS